MDKIPSFRYCGHHGESTENASGGDPLQRPRRVRRDLASQIWKEVLGEDRKSIRRAFKAHVDAVEWIHSENARLHGKPLEIDGLSANQLAEVRVALAMLGRKASLIDAAEAWLKHVEPFIACPTVEEIGSKLVAAKKASGVGDAYADELAEKIALYFDGFLRSE